jgi:hypothetical protein
MQRETNVHFERAYRLFIKSLGSPEQEMRAHIQQMTRAVHTATMTIEKQLLEDVV